MVTGVFVANSPISAFVESPVPPSWTGTFTSFFDAAGIATFGQGINNNGDVAGYNEVQYLNDYALLFTNGVQFASFQYPGSNDTYANSVNDYGQIVGYYRDSVNGLHAFIAVPQP